MTQGALGHTGAQGRAKGFNTVVKKYPNIEVLDTQPADWDVTEGRRGIWETCLTKYPKIDAAFFHNDDMALAAYNVMKAHNRTEHPDRRRRRHAAGDPGGQRRPHVRDRAQSVLPHPWRRASSPASPRWRRARRPDGRHPEERRHRRAGRDQGERARACMWMEDHFLI